MIRVVSILVTNISFPLRFTARLAKTVNIRIIPGMFIALGKRNNQKILARNSTRPLPRADIVVLRSPPPWVFRFQILGAFFSKLKFRVFCYS